MLTTKEKCYLSPALLTALIKGDQKPTHDFWKSDIYSLGMTMLEVMTLNSCLMCYDWNNFKVQHPMIDSLISDARSRYSQFLCGLIKDMLLEDEPLRPCFEDIHSLLLPYQEQI